MGRCFHPQRPTVFHLIGVTDEQQLGVRQHGRCLQVHCVLWGLSPEPSTQEPNPLTVAAVDHSVHYLMFCRMASAPGCQMYFLFRGLVLLVCGDAAGLRSHGVILCCSAASPRFMNPKNNKYKSHCRYQVSSICCTFNNQSVLSNSRSTQQTSRRTF